MRYSEIIEGPYADLAELSSKKLASKIEKVENARKKKNKAAHDYQNKLNSADASIRSALAL